MSAIQYISAEAKKIRKKHPKKEWKQCIAEASAMYKHKAKKSVGKKVVYKKSARKKVSGVKKVSHAKHITESKVLHEIEKVKHDIKTLENMQKNHMMKKHKRAIGATIRKKHTEIRKLLKKY